MGLSSAHSRSDKREAESQRYPVGVDRHRGVALDCCRNRDTQSPPVASVEGFEPIAIRGNVGRVLGSGFQVQGFKVNRSSPFRRFEVHGRTRNAEPGTAQFGHISVGALLAQRP